VTVKPTYGVALHECLLLYSLHPIGIIANIYQWSNLLLGEARQQFSSGRERYWCVST